MYMLLRDDQEEGYSMTLFDTRVEADTSLYNQLLWADKAGCFESHVEAYELYEVTQQFNVATAFKSFKDGRESKIANALNKLTLEDKVILGLTKA